MFMKIVLTIIGSIRSRILVSSTCVTVHKLQELELLSVDASVLLIIAARSKNLQHLVVLNVDEIANTKAMMSNKIGSKMLVELVLRYLN